MSKLPTGIYDLLHTPQLQKQLEEAGLLDRAKWTAFDKDDLKHRLAIPLAKELAHFIAETISGSKESDWLSLLNERFLSADCLSRITSTLFPVAAESLDEISPPPPLVSTITSPDTPLSVSALLAGSSRSPALRTQLMKELSSCDRADWIVSFIKYAGLVPLLPVLREFTQTPAPDGGPRLRVATTSYMGATDTKAVKTLLDLPNTEVRISYDTKRTRLHAKAYLFHRQTGFGSAYIGSANVSKAALDEGLEWTAKISQYETEHLWKQAIATFESHWEDENEFTPCKLEDLPSLQAAISKEQGTVTDNDISSFFDLRAYTYQQAILDDIHAERSAGKNKHLIIAATGTGKTMIAAFDYKHFCAAQGGRKRLLFVAHREEILKQALSSFRHVLRDGSFGDLIISGACPTQNDHLFCTVQSWNARNYDSLPTDHFDYIVLDEAHHASAESYQRLINHIKPTTLLGLTATPERTDGADIRQDFGGSFTHEIRLPEAIDRAILCPFHYYGIPDLDGLDFSGLAWSRGGYDVRQLADQLEGNKARAQWVMTQLEEYVADIKAIRGLGFCVSVLHAQFMADFCNEHGVPAIALTGESPKEQRKQAQRRLEQREFCFIFTVDLYNEGVDIPCIDTVLLLRPTESLTLFLQQLGRGLRLHEEKPHLTVLDFIAPQHRNFNYAQRFKALSSRPELRTDKQIESGMPFVPSGCLLHLEKKAKEHVLNNIRAAAGNLRGQRLITELRQLQNQLKGPIHLKQMLDYLHLDSPDQIYAKGLPYALMAKASGNSISSELEAFEDQLAKGFRRFLLTDDTHLIKNIKQLFTDGTNNSALTKELLHTILWSSGAPRDGKLESAHAFLCEKPALLNDLMDLINWLLENRTPSSSINFKDHTGPLSLHSSYTRQQILLSLGLGSFENNHTSREGVLHVPKRQLDVFFADINKSEDDFTPTTMYDDYAITDRLFHWQSQSQTSELSIVGQRYINHTSLGYTPLLFVRDRKKHSNGLTAPYLFAGPLKYRSHQGSKPISFIWELEHPLPAKALSWARRVD